MSVQFIRERFEAKFHRGDQCWQWIGAKTPSGYGKMGVSGKTIYAHHISMMLDGRPRPSGAIALHSCNNPSCVRPSHLSWGSQKDNMRQAISEGRASHKGRVPGEKNGNSKLTESDVLAIREDGRPRAVVAALYGVSENLISKIVLRQAWKHI